MIAGYLDQPNMVPLFENRFVHDLLAGRGTVEAARAEMPACSPYYFLRDLPPIQIHHGLADRNVPADNTRQFAEHWRDAGRDAAALEVFLYDGEGHDLGGVVELVNGRIGAFFEGIF